jgi:hypothetical protein
MGRFLNFDVFITTRIMKILYVVGTILIIVGSLIAAAVSGVSGIMMAVKDAPGPGLMMVLMAIAYLIGGVLWALFFRVWCEVLIVAFKINENLQAIRERSNP